MKKLLTPLTLAIALFLIFMSTFVFGIYIGKKVSDRQQIKWFLFGYFTGYEHTISNREISVVEASLKAKSHMIKTNLLKPNDNIKIKIVELLSQEQASPEK